MTQPHERTANEQPTELKDSNPSAAGPDRAAGGMGVSSERVGPTGGGGVGTDGEKDTTEPAHVDEAGDLIGSDAESDQGARGEPRGHHPEGGLPVEGSAKCQGAVQGCGVMAGDCSAHCFTMFSW